EGLLRLELPARAEAPGSWRNYPTQAAPPAVAANGLAYAAFTSGSTGKPKGILGSHAPISHFLQWQAREFGLAPSDRFSLLAGLSHDPLLRDVFAPLWIGATLHVPRPEDIAPARLAQWLKERAITDAHLTPPLGELLAEPSPEVAAGSPTLPSVRYVLFGGDCL